MWSVAHFWHLGEMVALPLFTPPLSPSTPPSFFHFRLKNYFLRIFLPSTYFCFQDCRRLLLTRPHTEHTRFFVLISFHCVSQSTWLQRIIYRLCLLSHKCLHGLALTYLSQSCQPLSSVSRQSHTHQLHARPKILYNRRFGSFYCAAPTSWNTILHDPDLSVFDCTLMLMTVVLPTVPVFTSLHQRAFVTVCLLIGVIEIAVYYYYYYYYYLLCPR